MKTQNKSEVSEMKHNNIIDMSSYFENVRKITAADAKKPSFLEKFFYVAGRILDTSAAVVMALCVCVCTLLFFTML